MHRGWHTAQRECYSYPQDLGEDPLRGQGTVEIHVEDVDDLDPEFEPSFYSMSISENSTLVSSWHRWRNIVHVSFSSGHLCAEGECKRRRQRIGY